MEFKKTIQNIVSDTSSLIGDSYDEATFLIKDTFGKFSDVKNITKEKMAGLANELLELIPIIEQTGYRAKEVEIGVSVPPRIVFHFEKFKEVNKEEREEILTANKSKTLLKIIVSTLVSADEFQQKLTLGKLKFSEIAIEMGIPPEVNVKLINTSIA